jgi:hypothetical protein
VAESYGVFAKTKKKCLREMLAWYENFYGVPYESDTVKEALS